MWYWKRLLQARIAEKREHNEHGFTLLEEAAAIFLSVPVLLMAASSLLYGLMILHLSSDTANRQAAIYGTLPSVLNDLNDAQPLGACNYVATDLGPANPAAITHTRALETNYTSSPSLNSVALNSSTHAANLAYYLPFSITFSKCLYPNSYGSALYGIADNGVCFYSFPTLAGTTTSSHSTNPPNLDCLWVNQSTTDGLTGNIYMTSFKAQNLSKAFTEFHPTTSSSSSPTYTDCSPTNCWTQTSPTPRQAVPALGTVLSSYTSVSGCNDVYCNNEYVGHISNSANVTPPPFSFLNSNGGAVQCSGSGSALECTNQTTPTASKTYAFTYHYGTNAGHCASTKSSPPSNVTITCTVSTSNGSITIPDWMAATSLVRSVQIKIQVMLSTFSLHSASATTAGKTSSLTYTSTVVKAAAIG